MNKLKNDKHLHLKYKMTLIMTYTYKFKKKINIKQKEYNEKSDKKIQLMKPQIKMETQY